MKDRLRWAIICHSGHGKTEEVLTVCRAFHRKGSQGRSRGKQHRAVVHEAAHRAGGLERDGGIGSRSIHCSYKALLHNRGTR